MEREGRLHCSIYCKKYSHKTPQVIFVMMKRKKMHWQKKWLYFCSCSKLTLWIHRAFFFFILYFAHTHTHTHFHTHFQQFLIQIQLIPVFSNQYIFRVFNRVGIHPIIQDRRRMGWWFGCFYFHNLFCSWLDCNVIYYL